MPPHRSKQYLEQVKNEIRQKKIPSQNRDGSAAIESVYNAHCLALDTKIPLLDGRTLTLQEMINEYEDGKENWVYSCHPTTGQFSPGIVSWAGITKTNAKTIKLTFDNGETLTCTPDHKIPVQGKGFVEAQHITLNDSLFPFNIRHHPITSYRPKNTYTQIFCNNKKQWNYVHREVQQTLSSIGLPLDTMIITEGAPLNTIHHSNFNRYDNTPNNLKMMNNKDHAVYHTSVDTTRLNEGRVAFFKKMKDNPELYKAKILKGSNTRKNSLNNNPVHKQQLLNLFMEKTFPLRSTLSNTSLNFSEELFNRLLQLLEINMHDDVLIFLEKINNDQEFMSIFKNDNNTLSSTSTVHQNKVNNMYFSKRSLDKLIKQFGHVSWKSLQSHLIAEKIPESVNNGNTTEEIDLINFTVKLIKNVSTRNHALVNYLKNNQTDFSQFKVLYNKCYNTTLNVPESKNFEKVAKTAKFSSFKHMVTDLSKFNHKVIKIENDQTQTVGTLTIDQEEKYNNYHTFAISSGIYVKNSTNEDFFFAQRSDGKGSKVEVLPGGCLSMDTKIPLLDGRELTIAEITKEYKEGKSNWAYSLNTQTGNMIPGIISWAGITHTNKELFDIVLDNGQTVSVTADHNFPTWNKGKVPLSELEVGDSLIHFERRQQKIGKRSYDQVYNHQSLDWEFTHRVVRKHQDSVEDNNTLIFEEQGDFNVIHHVDGNALNNTPLNLAWMNRRDHIKLHKSKINEIQHLGTKAASEKFHSDEIYRQQVINRLLHQRTAFAELLKVNPERANLIKEKLSKTAKQRLSAMSEEQYSNFIEQSKLNLNTASSKRLQKFKEDPLLKQETYDKARATLSYRLKNDPTLRMNNLKHIRSVRKSCTNQSYTFSPDMITIVKHLFEHGATEVKQLTEKLNNTPEFMSLWCLLNQTNVNSKQHFNKIIKEEFKIHHLDGLFKYFGYKNWKDFKKERLSLVTFNPNNFSGLNSEQTELVRTLIQVSSKSPSVSKIIKEGEFNLLDDVTSSYNRLFGTSIIPCKLKHDHFNRLVQHIGYKNWKDFIAKKAFFNHKIVSITKREGLHDVGTITIDQNEKHNPFHTFALSAGVYTYNSGLGELSDLEYFLDKVFRGLRIPVSYMSVGKDANPIFNDGKVGQAYIEELRFAKFCIRLQRSIAKTLDREFKNFLKSIGIQHDATSWCLDLPPPTNFELYKQMEADAQLLNTLSSASSLEKYFSPRYALERFAQMDAGDILRNEKLMAEEKGVKVGDPDYYKKIYGDPENMEGGMGGAGLGDLGGMGGGGLGGGPDLSMDMDAGDETMGGGDLEELGDEDLGDEPPPPDEGNEPPAPEKDK